jgi:maleate cis-trans isomerase
MIGWRARLGFLVPPGNPTVETEMTALAPEGVSVHFHRMVASGNPGSLDGQTGRTRMMVDNIEGSVELLAMVEPDVVVVAHTATSYYLGRQGEADLLARLERLPAGASSPRSARLCARWSASAFASSHSGPPIQRRSPCRVGSIWKPTDWR